jgi:hypothetical protein
LHERLTANCRQDGLDDDESQLPQIDIQIQEHGDNFRYEIYRFNAEDEPRLMAHGQAEESQGRIAADRLITYLYEFNDLWVERPSLASMRRTAVTQQVNGQRWTIVPSDEIPA